MVEENSGGNSKVIQGLTAQVNSLEDKINAFKDALEEQNDLQTVNRLDIINIKNDVEKMKMSLPMVSDDMGEKMKDIQKLMEKSGRIGDIDKIANDVDQIKKQLQSMDPSVIEEMKENISFLNESFKKKPAASADPEIKELKKRLDELGSDSSAKCKKCGGIIWHNGKFCGKCGKKI